MRKKQLGVLSIERFDYVLTLDMYSVLPLARIFPCSKEILVLARNLQGNEMHKEMKCTRKWQGKIEKLKEIARISVTYTSFKSKTT
jgi:hypothetical protein